MLSFIAVNIITLADSWGLSTPKKLSETGQISGSQAFSEKTHGMNGLKFGMLMYPDNLKHWLDFGHGLLIFLILVAFWLSETGKICSFHAFAGERMGGMA